MNNDRPEEQDVTVHEANTTRQGKAPRVSRRKLIASLGLTGAAVVAGGLLHKVGGASVSEAVYGSGDDADLITYRYAAGSPERTVGNKLREAVSVKDFGAKGDGSPDDDLRIQQAIDEVKARGGGYVYLPVPQTAYNFSNGGIMLHEFVHLVGEGDGPTSTVIRFTGTGYAIRTSGKHQRNTVSGIRIELNGTNNGIKFGDLGASLPENTVPAHFSLRSISIANVGAGRVGLEMNNVSHANLTDVKIGFGTIGGGNGFKFYADKYNSGVIAASDCTFGRVDASYIGLEIDGTVNIDSLTFVGCYLGGELPAKIGANTFVRIVNFLGCHVEARKLKQSGATQTNCLELHKVLGGSWIGGTVAAFGAPNSNAFVFKSVVEKFTIQSVEANAVMGTLFLNNGATTVEDCILHAPRLTNGSTAAIFSEGFSDKNFKFDVRKFTTENIRVKHIFSVDGANKIDWGTQNPALDSPALSWTRGDERINQNPVESGTAGNKYVLQGWKCISSGTPGTWVEMRCLTGN